MVDEAVAASPQSLDRQDTSFPHSFVQRQLSTPQESLLQVAGEAAAQQKESATCFICWSPAAQQRSTPIMKLFCNSNRAGAKQVGPC